MKINNKYTLLVAATAVLALNACGGGSSKKAAPAPVETNSTDTNSTDINNTDTNSTNNTDTKVALCGTGFTALKKDDKITATAADTKIKIRHTQDGNKEACTESGDAKLN